MSDHPITDDAANRILSGRVRNEDEAQLADLLARLVDDGDAPVPVPSAALARAFATGVIADPDDSVVVAFVGDRTRVRRRRSIAVRSAVVVGAMSMAFGGVAAAGALPDNLQAAAADAARVIGVRLPDPRRVELPEPGLQPVPGVTPSTVEPDDVDDATPDVSSDDVLPDDVLPDDLVEIDDDPRHDGNEGDDDHEGDDELRDEIDTDSPGDDDQGEVDEGEVDDDPTLVVDDDLGEPDDDPASWPDEENDVDDDPIVIEDDATPAGD